MNIIGYLFKLILTQPLINLLVLGYNYIPGHSIGLVIILLTIFVRLLLAPSFHKSLKSQRSMTMLQPKMNEIRERHKDDREAQAKAMMELYKEHKINPLGSCLPLLIQLPILIALYSVFRIALGNQQIASYLYPFVHNPGIINPTFFKIVNLSQPSWVLGVFAGLAQYWQSKIMLSGAEKSNDDTQNAMAMQTLYILPLVTIFISLRLPAGLPLYWITTTLFAVVQQYYIMRNNKLAAKPE